MSVDLIVGRIVANTGQGMPPSEHRYTIECSSPSSGDKFTLTDIAIQIPLLTMIGDADIEVDPQPVGTDMLIVKGYDGKYTPYPSISLPVELCQ